MRLATHDTRTLSNRCWWFVPLIYFNTVWPELSTYGSSFCRTCFTFCLFQLFLSISSVLLLVPHAQGIVVPFAPERTSP
ncbi:hypothetical protein VFPPC_15840 [Pochonia chlamydosporia 170]|uniref:Uncharacterized protein n=1 Tax=Pochonia chlamydosporia 170 TaxID=1380566 RepID=A0A179FTT7_METCM|nr:hypothetical protein VFPPC_15840 [Pochonia chlamydosporia 170]OAQ68541.1 hypothetical protein VFPPC_15840 [Pochonia chlamydosporia 170]